MSNNHTQQDFQQGSPDGSDDVLGLSHITSVPAPAGKSAAVFHPLDEIVAQIDTSISLSQTANISASTSGKTAEKTLQEKYFVFSLAEGRYAIPISHMQEVGTLPRVTPLPGAPGWLRGLTSLRGTIISIVDCGSYFQLPRTTAQPHSRLCVVSTKENDVATGLIVDRIEGMLYCDESQIRVPGDLVQDRVSPWLRGVYEHEGRLVNLLNVEQLLHSLDSVF